MSLKRIEIPFEYGIKSYGPEIIYKSDTVRVYEGATLLTPGKWADSISKSYILYKSPILSKYATNWVTNHINLGHDNVNPLSTVGTVHKQRWEDGVVKGDLYINTALSNGREIVTSIDAGLVNKLSVEMNTDDYWDSTEKAKYADNIRFLGLAIIGNHPAACDGAKIK